MTDVELFNLGAKYYNGEEVERDLGKAVACFRQAAEMGFAPAQYQMGRFYLTGKGVDINAGEGAEWLEKASAQGYEEAKHVLANLKLGFIRSSVLIAGAADNEVAKEYALDVLKLVGELSAPTEEDQYNRREAYRYLGMLTVAGHWKEESALLQAKAYYEKGLPIHEATDTDAMYTYCIVLDNLGDVTGESSYYSAAYDAALEIFQNAFDRFTDPDDKAMILSFLVMEKILGRFHPVDLDMAEKLNEIIGTLGSSNAAMYENYKRTIEQKRREIRMSSLYSDPSYTPSSSSGESGANLGKKVKGFLGNLFR